MDRHGSNFGHVVRDNPLPVALIGAGVGWLLMSYWRSNGSAQRSYEAPETSATGEGERTGRAGRVLPSDVKQRAYSAYDSARRTASDTVSAARERVSRLGEDLRGRARDLGSAATDRAQKVSHDLGEMIEERPLMLGAAGLVIGAALGAVLPRTRYEDEMLGETRDELTRSAAEFGREQLDKAQRVVERTVETVREEAERQGLTPEALRETAGAMANRAAKVAQSAADAAREEANRPGDSSPGGGAGGAGSGIGVP